MSEPVEVPPTTGPIAGKYDLVRLIGRGGMGAVWEGRHASLGTRVAIKFIDTEYADSQEARARFDNEARAAATIQSKHAIQIFDHGLTNDGKPYIVMELLVGEALDSRIDRLQRMPLGDVTRILRQVARALARAHEKGIVHRDLKPENIFLVRTPDEDEEIAKVLDFGIAKFKKVDGQSPTGLSSSTKTGAVLGTPFYMAPEQARGLREIDHRADLWSMGVIAFKCVCGVLPFEGVSVGDLLVKICTSPPPVPSTIVPSLSPAFDAWFARALDKDPARRFQTAAELSDALAYAAGVSIRRASSPTPTSDPMAASAASVPPRSLEPDSPNVTSAPFTSSTRGGSSSRGVWVAAVGSVVIGASLAAFALTRTSPKPAPQGSVQSTGGAMASQDVAIAPLVVGPAAIDFDASIDPLSPSHDPHRHPTKPGKTVPPLPLPSASTTPSVAKPVPSALPEPQQRPAVVEKPVPTAHPSANVMDPGY